MVLFAKLCRVVRYINLLREQFLQPVPVTLCCNIGAVPYHISNIPRKEIPGVLDYYLLDMNPIL